jgi:polygalacturonase
MTTARRAAWRRQDCLRCVALGVLALAPRISPAGSATIVRVADHLPAGAVEDGSVAYRAEVQAAIDAAAARGAVLEFPPVVLLADEAGWRLSSGLTVRMHGTTFVLGTNCARDGAVFHAPDVRDLTMIGGRIIGRNDAWRDGVNIRGVHITGAASNVRIRDMHFRDLSSNGIGLFGDTNRFIRDVWIEDVVVENCCKRYPDYLSGEKSEAGSVREDQGDVALYFVEDFVVRGCRFERSRSDGTHFYRCRNGQITDNRIYRAKMGGYFLETCENVVGHGNIVIENGSRGATIERGSVDCVFADNVVRLSGREGLWAPDCIGLVVTGNVFDRNGLKPNGPEARFIWNANITINEAYKEPFDSPTRDYLVAGNQIRTGTNQIAAIRVDATTNTHAIVIRGNQLLGENTRILVEGPRAAGVTLEGN